MGLLFHVKRKSLAEFRARRRERNIIVFAGGVYVGKNTSRPVNV